MKMSDYFGELSLCGDCIEDDSFHYATTSCEYVVNGVDAGQAICHAINNHDKLVDLNYRLAEALDLILNKKIACDLGREGINVYRLLAECGIERG